MARILSIDPSGTGTTGIFFSNGQERLFREFKSKHWQEHYAFVSELVKQKQPNLIIYESTNFIRIKGIDMTSLFKLFGALECLKVKAIKNVNVLKVKELYKQLLTGKKQVKHLSFKQGQGKGWMYENKRISKHCLDALLVYWLCKESKN